MIRIHSLSKTFGRPPQQVKAVDSISFEVHAGEVYGLLGPNGAGKTTILRMIMGLHRPDSGYAEVRGFRSDVAVEEIKRCVGMVSAADGVYPWLSVREMLMFFGDLYGMSVSDARQSLRELSDLLDLDAILDRRCHVLSTGQRQRVILARGLMHSPPVVLLDEPTRGLDVVGVQVVMDYMAHLAKIGKSVILSTHRLDEAQRLCQRFGLLHQGRLVYEGTMTELRKATGCESLVEIFHQVLLPGTRQGD
ncbi:MAG: ATP-binding cassette domain-containing protein [Planctomycetota bacterium]|nr:ATP-binding cassette domain-containing protein [Planctomycetota bacterium]MDA1179576.1 ATP-binding cassette domain-containing protein [Planctomycetota bacterium]